MKYHFNYSLGNLLKVKIKLLFQIEQLNLEFEKRELSERTKYLKTYR